MARLDPMIADLAKEFILVRLNSMRGVNLNLFEFDYDLTWMGFFLNADETILGRYGGRDAASADGRMSLAGLRHAMTAALAGHRKLAADKPASPERPVRVVEDYAAAYRYRHGRCLHCHQVYDIRRESRQAEGIWRQDEVWVYPLPENVGLTLDVDEGNRVRAVAPRSPAEHAGIAVGDRLLKVADVAVTSQADVQAALHRAPPRGEVALEWRRGDRVRTGRLALADGWRRTDLSWRWSLRGLEPNPWVAGADLSPAEKRSLGLPPHRLAFAQGAFVSKPARQAGIEQDDVIVGIDGKELAMTARQFQAYVRLNYQVGARVTYQIARDGRKMDVPLTLVKKPPF